MPKNTMKVAVTLVIDVDREAWDAAYSTGTQAGAVRKDVRSYVLNATQSLAPVDEGGFLSVELKAGRP